MSFQTTIIAGKTNHLDKDLMFFPNDLLNGNSGIVGPGDFTVTQNSPLGMSVLVTSGIIYAYVSSAGTYYRHKLTDATSALTIDPNSSGSTRIDIICVKTDLTITPDADGGGVPSLIVVKGTPGAGIPSTPANHYKLAEVSVADGASNITNANITDKRTYIKLRTVLQSATSADGWTTDTNTWVYASASTLTIAGVNVTGQFTKGTRLKFVQSGTTKYAVVVASSFSTNTTVTILVNTDHVIANAPITTPLYSYEVSPQGYPTWFNVAAPSYDVATIDNASGGQPTTIKYKLSILGNIISGFILGSGTKATTDTYFRFNAPLAYANANNIQAFGSAFVDASAGGIRIGVVGVADNQTYVWIIWQANITDNQTIQAWGASFSYEF